MAFVRNLNKKLKKLFDGQVAAEEDGGCLVLSGELARWSDVVLAGKTAIMKNPYHGFVNDIVCTGEKPMPMRKSLVDDSALEWEEPDVLIIGGGVIGCAIARELSKYKISVLLAEKESDLALHASGRNTGIVQSGNGLNKASKRYMFTRHGNAMFETVCKELGVYFRRSGQCVYYSKRFFDPFLVFTSLYWKWMGIKGVKVLRGEELLRYEPSLRGIGAALYFPESGTVCPFDLTLAYAENAVQNGAVISLNTMIQSMTVEDGFIKSVKTNRGTIIPKVVVNAAGACSEVIASMAGDRFFSIRPVKGTTAVLDKKYTDKLVRTVISARGAASVKKNHTRDGNIVRTVFDNTLVGPDSVETPHKEDFSTAPYNIKEIMTAQKRVVPELDENQIITYFSGIRAATYEEDFVVSKGRYVTNIVHAAGIQVPGLTAAPAIGVEISKMVLDFFGGQNNVSEDPEFNPIRIAPQRLSTMEAGARAELIESNPDYGIIVCRCEEISKGEIINTMRRNVRCDSIDGVKRRSRAGMGRCHGSCCAPQVLDIISAEKRLAPHNVRKSGSGSEKLFGNSKNLMQKKSSSYSLSSRSGSSRTDTETLAKLHKLQAAKDSIRKDSEDDGNE